MQDRLLHGEVEPPRHLAARPVQDGYIVPYFVAWIDGVADFRVVDTHKFESCRKFQFCWLCGKPLGAHRVFVIGPMCVINRTTSEPPSHRACAEYAAQVCPHIVHPKAKRRSHGLPEQHHEPGGVMVKDNPGMVVLWESQTYRYYNAPNGGVLVDIGSPSAAPEWWIGGRRAGRTEVLPLFETSVERLKKLTAEHYDQTNDPEERIAAFLEIGKQTGRAMQYLPVN